MSSDLQNFPGEVPSNSATKQVGHDSIISGGIQLNLPATGTDEPRVETTSQTAKTAQDELCSGTVCISRKLAARREVKQVKVRSTLAGLKTAASAHSVCLNLNIYNYIKTYGPYGILWGLVYHQLKHILPSGKLT